MINRFEQAVNNNEIIAFFKGEGIYLSPTPDSRGYHQYTNTWISIIEFLKNKDNGLQLLVKYFRLYLGSLEDTLEDAWDLFSNIKAYYIIRNENNAFLDYEFDLIEWLDDNERQKIGYLFRLLRDNFDKIPDSNKMLPFDTMLKTLKSWGCQHDFFSF